MHTVDSVRKNTKVFLVNRKAIGKLCDRKTKSFKYLGHVKGRILLNQP